ELIPIIVSRVRRVLEGLDLRMCKQNHIHLLYVLEFCDLGNKTLAPSLIRFDVSFAVSRVFNRGPYWLILFADVIPDQWLNPIKGIDNECLVFMVFVR